MEYIKKSECPFRNLVNMAVIDGTRSIGDEKGQSIQIKDLESMIGHLIQDVLTDEQLTELAYRDKSFSNMVESSKCTYENVERPRNLMSAYIGDMLTYSNKLFSNLTYNEKIKAIGKANYLYIKTTSRSEFRANFVRVDSSDKNTIIVQEFDDEWENVDGEVNVKIEWIDSVGY